MPKPRHRSRNRRPGIPAGHTDHRHRSLADLKQHRPRDPNRPRRGQTPGSGRQRPNRPDRRKPQGIGPTHRRIGTGASIRPGVGPVTAAIIICAYSHHGHIRSEAAFAALGGVAPRPASSGNTTRHRLNRSGDRQLNRAFDVIVRTRMSFDPDTKDYVTSSRATRNQTARSAAISNATSAAPFSASCRPSWLDRFHRRVILG